MRDRPPALRSPGLEQCPDGKDIADDNRAKGHGEAHSEDNAVQHEENICAFRVEVQAFLWVIETSNLFAKQRAGGCQNKDPYHCAGYLGILHVGYFPALERVDNGGETNHAEHGEKVNAAIHVHVQGVRHNPAGNIAKYPMRSQQVIGGPKGQSAHKHEI